MKILTKVFSAAACLGLGLIVAPAFADTLQMKDGTVIQGRYAGGTQNKVQFEMNGTVDSYDVDQIISLTFSAPPPPQPAPQPTAQSDAPPPAQDDTRPDVPTPRPPRPDQDYARSSDLTVPAGTHVLVRMIDSVDSDKNHVGDRFHASLEQDLVVNGVLVATRGSDVYGRLSEAKESGHFQGRSELTLELTDLLINNRLQPILTGDYDVSGSSRGANTAKKVGGGAVAGAIIGAIAGGGKGAAIGTAVGATAGGAVQVMTKGEQVHVPSETLLDFRIEQPFTVPDGGR